MYPKQPFMRVLRPLIFKTMLDRQKIFYQRASKQTNKKKFTKYLIVYPVLNFYKYKI